MEKPAHAFLERLDLGQGCSRDYEQCDVAVREVDQTSVKVIGHKRAARATLLPTWTEHEVVHKQLTPPVEKIGERLPAVHTIEHMLRSTSRPGQLSALPGSFISSSSLLVFVAAPLF